jgi:hypothetical protein
LRTVHRRLNNPGLLIAAAGICGACRWSPRCRVVWRFAGGYFRGDDRNRTGVDGFAARRFGVRSVFCAVFPFVPVL